MNDGSNRSESQKAPRQRQSARVALMAEVQLRRSGHHHYVVNVYDISPEGCRLEFVERPRIDETLCVKFEGLDPFQSMVCWIEGHAAGLEFARPLYPAVFELVVSRLK